jgi:ribosome-binding factor A
MTNRRMTRVNELLKREISTTLYRVLANSSFDLAAATVTRVVTSNNLRNAEVYISILNHEDQRDEMLSLLRERRGEIQKIMSRNVVLKYTPRLTFKLDTSLAEGDRVLSVLDDLQNEDKDSQPGYPGETQLDHDS